MIATHQEIAVVRMGDGWQVISPHSRGKSFQYRVDAEEHALRQCQRERAAGREVRLLLHQPDGELRAIAVSEGLRGHAG